MMRCLVTGGAGYIGSHLVVELLSAGHDVIVLDDFSSGHPEAIVRAGALAGRRCRLLGGDIGDAALLSRALSGVDVVFHLAGYKSIADSMARPEEYFANNIGGTVSLLGAMQEAGVRRIVYSSSASVYGGHHRELIGEDAPLLPESPYGVSKAEGERLLGWMVRLRGWSAISLRYFNPVGAHPSGEIGESFEQTGNLLPRVLKVLTRDGPPLTIFGTDYDTPDGTCLRDYIHICDLSRAHLVALELLGEPGHSIFNVGTGRPRSVRQVLDACERATGRKVPAVEGPRRPGDVAMTAADPSLFREATGFQTRFGLDEMVASAWRWCQKNPSGYLENDR